MRRAALLLAVVTATATGAAPSAHADDLADLAKKLANPIAALTSVPFQYNYDARIGPAEDGTSNYVHFQPVTPIRIDQDWNVISRLVMPIVEQEDVKPGSGTQFGLADSTASFFLSPQNSGISGLTWGIGPAVNFPATESALGSQKWGLGPTAAIVVQPPGPWTIGVLTRQIWSVGGSRNEADINETFLQAFVSYTTDDAWTCSLNTESFYYWTDDEASVPINLQVAKLFRLGGEAISLGPGIRYWAPTRIPPRMAGDSASRRRSYSPPTADSSCAA